MFNPVKQFTQIISTIMGLILVLLYTQQVLKVGYESRDNLLLAPVVKFVSGSDR